jgi:AcrR family transcriptional regulator
MPLERRRELLLETAASLFGEAGGQAISLDTVAARAGVAKPAIYELFGSKQDLFEAAVESELDRLVAHMTDAHRVPDEAGDVTARTRARVDAVFSYVRENPAPMRLLLSASRHPTAGIADLQGRAREEVTDSLALTIGPELAAAGIAVDEDGVWAISAMVVEMVVSAALLSLEHPAWDPDAVADLVARFLIGGFGGLDAAAVLPPRG